MGRFLAELIGLLPRQHVEAGLSEEDLKTLKLAVARARRRLQAEGTLENELNVQREIRDRLNAA